MHACKFGINENKVHACGYMNTGEEAQDGISLPFRMDLACHTNGVVSLKANVRQCAGSQDTSDGDRLRPT